MQFCGFSTLEVYSGNTKSIFGATLIRSRERKISKAVNGMMILLISRQVIGSRAFAVLCRQSQHRHFLWLRTEIVIISLFCRSGFCLHHCWLYGEPMRLIRVQLWLHFRWKVVFPSEQMSINFLLWVLWNFLG